MKVDLFIPCFIDQLYPQTAFNTIKILEKAGVEVNYNPEQTCCGQASFNSGYWDETRDIGRKFLSDFQNHRPVVCPSASCTGFIRNYYNELFEGRPEFESYQILKSNLFELTDFLVNQLKVTQLGARFNAKITYHDACAALREYGIRQEPRTLLANVEGLELVEMPESDVCCGFGGTFSVKNEPISTAMAQQKTENALSTGAEYLVSTEASCLLHLDGYIRKHKLPIKTIHIADILAAGY